jgi:hypothetical protein
MTKPVFSLFLVFASLLSFSVIAQGVGPEAEQDAILSSAESLFRAMNDRRYSDIWSHLTLESRSRITATVAKAISQAAALAEKGKAYSDEEISGDFRDGGTLSQAYWNSYLDTFNPDLALEQSAWTLANNDKVKAEIEIKYKKSDRPAVLRMYKQEGKWKVGLLETFPPAKR